MVSCSLSDKDRDKFVNDMILISGDVNLVSRLVTLLVLWISPFCTSLFPSLLSLSLSLSALSLSLFHSLYSSAHIHVYIISLRNMSYQRPMSYLSYVLYRRAPMTNSMSTTLPVREELNIKVPRAKDDGRFLIFLTQRNIPPSS